MCVAVGVGLAVAVGVCVGTAVAVGVELAVGARVGTGVEVAVGTRVGTKVGVAVGVTTLLEQLGQGSHALAIMPAVATSKSRISLGLTR